MKEESSKVPESGVPSANDSSQSRAVIAFEIIIAIIVVLIVALK